VDRDLLVGIYERIQQAELKPGSDHTTQVRKVEETIVEKRCAVVSSRCVRVPVCETWWVSLTAHGDCVLALNATDGSFESLILKSLIDRYFLPSDKTVKIPV